MLQVQRLGDTIGAPQHMARVDKEILLITRELWRYKRSGRERSKDSGLLHHQRYGNVRYCGTTLASNTPLYRDTGTEEYARQRTWPPPAQLRVAGHEAPVPWCRSKRSFSAKQPPCARRTLGAALRITISTMTFKHSCRTAPQLPNAIALTP